MQSFIVEPKDYALSDFEQYLKQSQQVEIGAQALENLTFSRRFRANCALSATGMSPLRSCEMRGRVGGSTEGE